MTLLSHPPTRGLFAAFVVVALASASMAQPAPIRTRPDLRIPKIDTLQIRQLGFYELIAPDINAEAGTRLAERFSLKAGEQGRGNETIQAYLDPSGATRMVFRGGRGNNILELVPDLTRAGSNAPPREAAERMAGDFFRQNGLMPKDENTLVVGEVTTWTRQAGTEKGGEGAPQDALRNVRFYRQMDGLRVYGPNSILSAIVGEKGVDGFTRAIQPVRRATLKPQMKKPEAVEREFRAFLDPFVKKLQARDPGVDAKVVATDLVYYEQGQRYVQPAYRFSVLFTHRNGEQTGDIYMIPAASNTPERIRLAPERVEPPREPKRDSQDGLENLFAWNRPSALQANPIQYGMFINREDHDCWNTDAVGFHNNMQFVNTFAPWLPKKNRRNYYWNYPWLWHAAMGVGDNSASYGGRNHVNVIEGHGAPWLMTTLGNYGDVINVNGIAGLGANMGGGQVAAYNIWHSCSLVPVPGSPYGGNYASPANPWGAWWKIMKGMRGNYGYHVTMYICDQAGPGMGWRMAWGMPNLASWFHVTSNNPQGHPNGWNYGSACIVTGREGDTLYNNSPLPNPSSLTLWWVRP